jgi:hypothetical protein
MNCMIDVEAKTAAFRKLQGVAGKEAQAEQKEQAVSAAQDGADAAKLEFEKVSERLLTEFELFKNQKAFDIKEMMTNFVNLQVRGGSCVYLRRHIAQRISRRKIR